MHKNKVQNAAREIQRNLRAPGHKDALRAYNSSRRGERIAGTRIQQTKIQKARSRNAIRKDTRKEILQLGQ